MAGRWLFFLWLLFAAIAAGATAFTGGLRVQSDGNGVVVRLALSEALAAPPGVFALDSPRRWVIDLGGAASLRRQADGAGPIRQARVAQFNPDIVRLVVETSAPIQLIEASQDRDQVLILRFRPASAAAFSSAVAAGRKAAAPFHQEVPIAVAPGPAAASDPTRQSAARIASIDAAIESAEGALADRKANPPAKKPLPRRTVVLDAGHGGTDPGAPAENGRVEKEATLAIVRAARTAIESLAKARGLPIDVRLTRSDDRFIPLAERVRIARALKADLFISIHADSAPNAAARGASVYTLSEVASDREAARVAAAENRADLLAGVDLSHENREVATILVDLGRRDAMNASADFAATLKDGLEPEGVGFRSQFHRFANFQVLRNLGVPAVLVETGYLSNPDDASYLFSRPGQQAIARGIATAAIDYLSHH